MPQSSIRATTTMTRWSSSTTQRPRRTTGWPAPSPPHRRKEVGMLTDDEVRAVILACAHAPDGATEEDMGAAIRWAQGARTESLMLDLVLEGRVAITMRDGEPVFSAREGGGGD